MRLRFWFSFLASIFICFLMVFFIGLLLAKNQKIKDQKSFLKQNLKTESLLYLNHLRKQFDFWHKEKERIIQEESVSSTSPFFALILSPFSKEERVYFDKDAFSLQIIDQKQKETLIEKEDKILSPLDFKKEKLSGDPIQSELEKRNRLILFSKEIMEEELTEGFLLKGLKIKERGQALILIRVVEKERQWLGFFRFDTAFFTFSSDLLENRGKMKKEFFVINPEGQVFFHSNQSRIFKKISKKSKLWKSISLLLTQKPEQGRYITLSKKKGKEEIYYLQNWGLGDMLFLSKGAFSLPFFIDSFMILIVCLIIIFCLFFILFSIKLFSLISAYQFLKFAFLSFGRTKIFPSTSLSNNPLLYFYNNRQFFFNQSYKGEVLAEEDIRSVTFQDIVNQEIQKMKTKFPNLSIDKKCDYNIKVFGFERFLRTIIHELFLNAVEAMGSLKELKMDISLRKKEENIIFCVRDYGIGASEQNYKQLFEMYYSTKSQMGVGLNLAQSLVSANGGDIQFSSPEGKGLKVCIHLPLKSFLKNHSVS